MKGNLCKAITVRIALIDDIQKVASFLNDQSDQFPVPLNAKVNVTVYAEKLITNGVVLLAHGSNEIVGLAGGYANDVKHRTAFLSVIAVSQSTRGSGLADRLLDEFELKAKACGMVSCELETHVTNSRALAFYRRHGYINQGSGATREDVRLSHSLPWLTPKRPNILLSSVGRRTYLVDWFKKALKNEGAVCVTNSSPLTPAFCAADDAAISPLIYSDDYIPFLIKYCSEHQVGAVFPLFDIDIPILAANAELLTSAGILPMVPTEAFSKECSDKFLTAMLLGKSGIPHPKTYLGYESYMQAVSQGEAGFPAFVKPRWGMGSIGIGKAVDVAELASLCDVARHQISTTYLQYESACDLENAVVIQPALSGQEYGMDVINDLQGHYCNCVVRKKVAMRAGETDVADVVPADDRFVQLARRLSALSCHPGNMDVDIFDVDGTLYVLELNARFGGGYPFSQASGVDLPTALVGWLSGREINKDLLVPKHYGLFMKDIKVVALPECSNVS